MTYQIENSVSGFVFGVYAGETEEEALLAMAQDAGYESIEEMDSVTRGHDDLIISWVEE